MKREIDERTKRERIVKLHEGIVIQDFGSFVRVFNPMAPDKGGDLSPEMSQSYPLVSHRMWCEVISERAVSLPIPPLFRF